MANSKTIAVRQKHRRKQKSAKAKVRQHLSGRVEAEELPVLARRYLVRRLRVARKG